MLIDLPTYLPTYVTDRSINQPIHLLVKLLTPTTYLTNLYLNLSTSSKLPNQTNQFIIELSHYISLTYLSLFLSIDLITLSYPFFTTYLLTLLT